jgi:hypothetical protein
MDSTPASREIKFLSFVATGENKNLSVDEATRAHRIGGALDCKFHFLVSRPHNNGIAALDPARPIAEVGIAVPENTHLNKHAIVVGVCTQSMSALLPGQQRVCALIERVLSHAYPGLVVVDG